MIYYKNFTMNKYFITIMSLMVLACNDGSEKQTDNSSANNQAAAGTFAYDVKFLKEKDSGLVELREGESAVLVSGKYQAKVFTSTASGDNGKSFGWINYKVFSAAPDPHMNAYGGENRFWLGPEGGKYSLYFKQGDSMVFDNWKTPAPIDTESWEVDKRNDQAVILKKNISISNYAGTLLNMQVTREIAVQGKNEIESTLSIQL